MTESYSGHAGNGVVARAADASAISEAPGSTALARELISQLLPGVDADRLVQALLAERTASDEESLLPSVAPRYDSDGLISVRELRRVRARLALGESARTLQHAFNNPLTALLAEVQMLGMEELTDETRGALARILELTLRLAELAKRLGDEEAVAG